MRHPIRRGSEGGRFQPEPRTQAKRRYLLENKKVQTGPQGGKYQQYGRGKKRYLLD